MAGRDIEICWWCEDNPASTREHRIKRSRLNSEAVKGGPLTFSSQGLPPIELRGFNGKAVKFGKSLCQQCNSTRSQPFDAAYDAFVNWTRLHRQELATMPEIDWTKVFEGKSYDNRQLARYYVKNLCCRIIDKGMSVPRLLVNFLDDLTADPPLDLILYRDFDADDVSDPFSARVSQASGDPLPNSNEPECFITLIEDGFIGVLGYYPSLRGNGHAINIGQGDSSTLYDAKIDLMFAAPMFKDPWYLHQIFREERRLGRKLTGQEIQAIADVFNLMPENVPVPIDRPPLTVDPLDWLVAHLQLNQGPRLPTR